MKALRLLALLALALTACSATSDPSATTTDAPDGEQAATSEVTPSDDGVTAERSGPDAPEDLETALAALIRGFDALLVHRLVDDVVAFEDPRAAWVLADMLRFYPMGSESAVLLSDAIRTLGIEVDSVSPWKSATDELIAADLEAPPGYDALKAGFLGVLDARWGELFSEPVDMDLRLVSWGGVFIDDRAFGDMQPCRGRGCIPALDNPSVTDAAGGSWYPDEAIVFGIVVNGDARAYPKNQMQIHEMVNDELGGRRLGIPYCTLCGSAQAYFTDDVEGTARHLVMRTSGLLSRSNKVMYDLDSLSIFDTFTGRAVTGRLGADEVELEQVTVRVATWADWKAAHPDTTIVAEDGGTGRTYAADPLAGRDDDGPIFPIGDVDGRLEVHDAVVGVEAPDGTAVAFSVADLDQLADGQVAELNGVIVSSDGAGYVAHDTDGNELATHEAFWFAWSQFFPDGLLWEPN